SLGIPIQDRPVGQQSGAEAQAAGGSLCVTARALGAGTATDSPPRWPERPNLGDAPTARSARRAGPVPQGHKSVKEGLLLKQTSSFQRWKRRYFKLRGRTLYYAKDSKSLIFDEVDLSDASMAETSTKNVNNSFTVITPFRKLILCAENRKEMEDWISALKSVQKWEVSEATQFNMEHFSGMHNWYACSHARPTFCNVCREALSGVTSHGLSCEVCKFKAHKRCAVRATNNCKWTTLASIGSDIIEDEDGAAMPHQWLGGHPPGGARPCPCLRLWAQRRSPVHSACKEFFGRKCPLGQYKVSIIPPTALNSIDSDGECWSWLFPGLHGVCPVAEGQWHLSVIFQKTFQPGVNSPMQGSSSSPALAARDGRRSDPVRPLCLGSSGKLGVSMARGRVLSPASQELLSQDRCTVARWGGSGLAMCPQGWTCGCQGLGRSLQRGPAGPLARWSVLTYEAPKASSPPAREEVQISHYADSVAFHLAKILESDKHSVVISSANRRVPVVLDWAPRGRAALSRACVLEHGSPTADPGVQMQPGCPDTAEQQGASLALAPCLPSPAAVDEQNKQTQAYRSKKDSLEELGKAPEPLGEALPPRGSLAVQGLETLGPREAGGRGTVPAPQGAAGRGIGLGLPLLPARLQSHVTARPRAQLSWEASSHGNTRAACDKSCSLGPASRRGTVISPTSSIFLDRPDSFSAAHFAEDPNTMCACGPGMQAALCHVCSVCSAGVVCKLVLARVWRPFPAVVGIQPDVGQTRAGQFSERCVMNNYFGIGLDAKISLEFNNKRDEHPKKCSSRTKNMMWYGVLGTKELLQRTYKNLEQRVQLEASG
uniref:Diacylglycerol kinase eta n=1 Tax=Pelodiscus sinensis TaxID=13735 RepID=K7FT91_PELSI